MAVSLDRGDTLFAASPGTPLAPASNMKLLTTASALHYLGADFRYLTFLMGTGPVRAGRLEGDLVLYGTGDPGISDRFQATATTVFEAFADSLRALGVTRVEGAVVGDGSYFGGPLLAETWRDRYLNDPFAAPSGALAFNENVFTLRVRGAGLAGGPVEIITLPDGAGVPMLNLARVGGGSGFRIRRERPSDPIVLQGALASGGRDVWRQLTVPDPAHFAASVLRSVLQSKGIYVTGGVRTEPTAAGSAVTGKRIWAPTRAARPTPRILARHVSPPLHEYLAVVNKRSHNQLAEQVFKTVGRVALRDGSYRGGAHAVERFLADAGVDTSQTAVFDGSGLSPLNRVSAGDFIAVMDHMSRGPLWNDYWATLPEAGNPRELRRMYRTAAAGNLRAKTGTIDRVSALSGMVRSANGERIAFSIIANQVPTSGAKRIEDRIGVRLASLERSYQAAGPVVFGMGQEGTSGVFASPPTGEVREPGGAGAGPESETRVHEVRSNENLTTIARLYDVPLTALVIANPGVVPDRLRVGQKIEIPADEAGGR